MKDIRLARLAHLLVNYSVRVKKGDFVFISCEEVASPWMLEVARETILAGGHVETALIPGELAEIKLKNCQDDQLAENNYLFEMMLKKADCWISAWATKNTRANAMADPVRMQMLAKGSAGYREIYHNRMGDRSLRWVGTQFPTHADAQEANMSLADYEDFVYGAGLLDHENPAEAWAKISRQQQRWVEYLNGKEELHIIAPDTDIKMSMIGRTWENCDGQENFPDGEIYSSPVEESVNGHIAFSFPAMYAKKEVENVRLEVVGGKVVHATADKGQDHLLSVLQTDEGATRFGEVAIGTNYGIQRFTNNMLFDEKIGGTIHMALGDALPEIGGKNRSTVHWDMLCDLRKFGKVFADGQLFYENGRFIEDILKKS